MNKIEQRVLDNIKIDDVIKTLSELIPIRSLGGQETPAQEYVAEWMRRNGMEVDLWEIDMNALKQHPAFSAEVERDSVLGVVGWFGKGDGPSLILNGHVDVVPVGDARNWRYPPWQATLADGRVYGRGSVDMKGGLSCALHAVKAIRDAGVQLKGRLLVESVVGEEDGGTGALAAVLRGYHADGAVLIEPTELAIAPVQAGALSFKVSIPGLSAHGCVREEGVSAVDGFLPVYQALQELELKRNRSAPDPLYARYRLPYALCIGMLHAGEWSSSVIDHLSFQGRYGVIPGEDLDDARRQFETEVARAAASDSWLRDHPPVVEWWGGQFAPARIPVDAPIVETLSSAFQTATGAASRLEGMTYGSDMRILVNEGGIPAVLFGPGDVRVSHRPDEYVPVDDLLTVTRTLALAALRFCGVE
ncbi:MAG: ArgE/DapE family deacylase [Chloroflexi bacterium]|nr:MAG: ArgE/DapE family deacylase [Chloroflexota bacterium]